MKKLGWCVLVASLWIPGAAMAQNALDGTWKVDLNNAKLSSKPDIYLLRDGMWHCKTCVPAIDVKADGQDQTVAGHPYYDSISITIVDDHTVQQTTKKAGKVVGTSKSTVSADGKTLTSEGSFRSANGQEVASKGEATRVANGPAGSHAVSGSWRDSKVDSVSDNGLTVTFKVQGDSLTMTSPTGENYTAKLDGTDAPYNGDPGITSVSVRRLGKNAIEESDKRDGKVISVSKITVASSGQSLTMEFADKLHGTTSEFSAEKQ